MQNVQLIADLFKFFVSKKHFFSNCGIDFCNIQWSFFVLWFILYWCPCSFRQNQSCRFVHFECNSWPLTLVICTDQSVTPRARARSQFTIEAPFHMLYDMLTFQDHSINYTLCLWKLYGCSFDSFYCFALNSLFWNRIIPTSGIISQRNAEFKIVPFKYCTSDIVWFSAVLWVAEYRKKRSHRPNLEYNSTPHSTLLFWINYCRWNRRSDKPIQSNFKPNQTEGTQSNPIQSIELQTNEKCHILWAFTFSWCQVFIRLCVCAKYIIT